MNSTQYLTISYWKYAKGHLANAWHTFAGFWVNSTFCRALLTERKICSWQEYSHSYRNVPPISVVLSLFHHYISSSKNMRAYRLHKHSSPPLTSFQSKPFCLDRFKKSLRHFGKSLSFLTHVQDIFAVSGKPEACKNC